MKIGKHKIKSWPKNLERYIKIEKKLQFNGAKQSKIQWTDLKIKFIKGHKSFNKNWQNVKSKSWH